MNGHLKFLIIFVCGFWVMDWSLGFVVRQFLSGIQYGMYGSINEQVNARPDILILGSSRAVHHYRPAVLEERLPGLSAYNAGLGGFGLYFNYAILSTITEEYLPRMVILDISPNIIADPGAKEKLVSLLPYQDRQAFREILTQSVDRELMASKFIKGFKYNSTLYALVRSATGEINEDEDGYEPLSGVLDTSTYVRMGYKGEPIDDLNFVYFHKIIDLCQQRNIPLWVCKSPTYQNYDQEGKVIGAFRKICADRSVPFKNYESLFDSSGQERVRYFKDQLHLNSQGAEQFSEKIADDLRHFLLNNSKKADAEYELKSVDHRGDATGDHSLVPNDGPSR